MGNDDATRLIAGSLDQLGYGLSRLSLDQSGYITAEDYERITGEELDEFSKCPSGELLNHMNHL